MSCCGSKRKTWLEQAVTTANQAETLRSSQPAEQHHPARIFEYTGDSPLTLRGVASGKQYTFRFRGDRVHVDYTDSFAMMAERELRIVRTERDEQGIHTPVRD